MAQYFWLLNGRACTHPTGGGVTVRFWITLKAQYYYSIVGGLWRAPSEALRQVDHSVPLGFQAEPRACCRLTNT